jgi:predicted SprT family Zn-dependent metalloprotease
MDRLAEMGRRLLEQAGWKDAAGKLAVRWNAKMRSSAGRAFPDKMLVELNPRLVAFGEGEIANTFLHELAHLLAHLRAGRRRIPAHGSEWKRACADLGIPGEAACHRLPLPRRQVSRRHVYRCPACGSEIRRARPFRTAVACIGCCRRHAKGRYDERFRLVKLRPGAVSGAPPRAGGG